MNIDSIILRGYGPYDRIITRGYSPGWAGKIRAEFLRFVSSFTKAMCFTSERTGEINGA